MKHKVKSKEILESLRLSKINDKSEHQWHPWRAEYLLNPDKNIRKNPEISEGVKDSFGGIDHGTITQ